MFHFSPYKALGSHFMIMPGLLSVIKGPYKSDLCFICHHLVLFKSDEYDHTVYFQQGRMLCLCPCCSWCLACLSHCSPPCTWQDCNGICPLGCLDYPRSRTSGSFLGGLLGLSSTSVLEHSCTEPLESVHHGGTDLVPWHGLWPSTWHRVTLVW